MFYIPPLEYNKIREYLNNPNEVGGYFEIRGNSMIPIITTNGSNDSIRVSQKHPFVFHTHPGRCISKSKCSLGVPSSQDMRQILDASTYGNVAHFIFAHEGVYVVQARCAMLQQYMKDKSIGDSVKLRFKKFQDEFTHSDLDYNNWIRKWVNFANQVGFSVIFFPIGSALNFSLNTKCF